MEFTTAHSAPPHGSAPVASWQALADTCGTAVALSRNISARLRQGTPAHALVPQLQHQAEMAEKLRAGIGQLEKQDPSPAAATQRTRLIQQLEALLEQEQENQDLMNRKGVKLSGARPYRYTPPRT